jgi:hypothetical protein
MRGGGGCGRRVELTRLRNEQKDRRQLGHHSLGSPRKELSQLMGGLRELQVTDGGRVTRPAVTRLPACGAVRPGFLASGLPATGIGQRQERPEAASGDAEAGVALRSWPAARSPRSCWRSPRPSTPTTPGSTPCRCGAGHPAGQIFCHDKNRSSGWDPPTFLFISSSVLHHPPRPASPPYRRPRR